MQSVLQGFVDSSSIPKTGVNTYFLTGEDPIGSVFRSNVEMKNGYFGNMHSALGGCM